LRFFKIKRLNRIPDFDEIVFEFRNKEYGAFILRKKYSLNVSISLLIGIIIMTATILIPYINSRAFINQNKHSERQVEIKLENLDHPNELIVLPPPPPPPGGDNIQKVKYVPPVVVDSVNLEETIQLMTADDAQNIIMDEKVVEMVKEVKEELQEEKTESEPFLTVEEMPEFPGGLPGLMKFIAENTIYPAVAKELNIQGKVFVRFCVTSTGNIEQISILQGTDPELNAEAIRVVKRFPPFKPGKQYGRPVPVWYVVPFNFQLI
jgi:protein TonB